MNIWVIKDGEPLATLEQNARLMRAGLLSNYLSNHGHQVTFWTSTWSHYGKEKYSSTDLTLKDEKYGFKLVLLDSSGYSKNVSFRRIYHYTKLAIRFYRKALTVEPPDIIIAALPSIELSFAAVRYAKKVGCNVYIDLRDAWPDIFLEIVPNGLRWLIKMLGSYQFAMMKYLCRHATGLIGISPSLLEWGVKYASRTVSNRDTVLPLVFPSTVSHGVVDQFSEECTIFSKHSIEFNNKFTVVFAGTFSDKAFDLTTIIKAFDGLPNECQLIIAGKSLDNEILQKQIEALAITIPNVHLMGWLNKEQLDYMYTQVHIGVAPYIDKGYFKMHITNKPIEYLSHGLPVLTSLQGELSNLLVKYRAGFLYEAHNPESLRTILLNLYQNSELYNEVSKNSKMLHAKEFNYETQMEKFVKFLKCKKVG